MTAGARSTIVLLAFACLAGATGTARASTLDPFRRAAPPKGTTLEPFRVAAPSRTPSLEASNPPVPEASAGPVTPHNSGWVDPAKPK